MIDQQQSRWQPTRRQLLWAGGIAAPAFLILVICGYLFGWGWTGLLKRTLWDWLKLLIVPLVLALGGYLFTRSENRRAQDIADQQRTLDLQIADARRQDDTLQAYLDGMSQLLTDKDRPLHRAQLGDSLSTVARARTSTVLTRLDGDRKGSVVRFLHESGLIAKNHPIMSTEAFDLREADLSRAALPMVALGKVDLRGANLHTAHMHYADLSGAALIMADLRAGLRGANLSWATASGADLSGADLSYADLHEADLRRAYLWNADLAAANLRGADLSGADLSGPLHFGDKAIAAIAEVELERQAASLEGATMPSGQKYEEWLKSKGSGEDGGEHDPRSGPQRTS